MRLLAGLAGLSLLFAAAPRKDSWTILGPGGGGAQFFPSVSPHDPKLVFVACDMTGSYVSHDGGDNWRMFNLRGVAKSFTFDPSDPNVVYAATNSLWRSADRGSTWSLIYPNPKQVTASNMRNDHADERFVIDGKPAARVSAFAVHPRDRRQFYLAVMEAGGWQLLASANAGATWTPSGALPGGTRKLFAAPSGELWAVSQDAVHKRVNNEWQQGAATDRLADVSGGWSRNGDLILYAVTGAKGLVSDDAGRSWREWRLGEGANLRAIATSLHHPDTAYVSYSRLEGRWFGIAKTTDRGKTWTPVWREGRDELAKNVTYGWIEEKFGSGWAGNPLTLGVSPVNPEIAFGTDFGRTVRTTDGGNNWRAVYTRKAAAGWVSAGLDVTTAYSVHFDPFDKRRVFISYTDIGAFRSEDGGKTWVSTTDGVERAWTNTTYDLAFDPDVKGRVWGAFSGTHDLPRPKMWRMNSPSSYRGGVGVSKDGGRTWKMLKNAGIPETGATHLLIDPASPKESRTLYLAAFGRGVYKSTDGGASWVLKNNGLPAREPFAWRMARTKTGDLYLVVARRSDDGSIGRPDDGALFRSTDGADTWSAVPLPRNANGPNGIAVDPENPKRLYLAAWGRTTQDVDDGGGVFRSEDGGATWVPVLTRDRHVYDVTIDPKNPSVLYACGFESSAWRSADRGNSWTRIRGYNFKWGHRVIPDPDDRASIYITTFGGSVWHGPATGDPKAPEDIDAPWLPRILGWTK